MSDPVIRRRNAILTATLVLVLVGSAFLFDDGGDGWVKPAVIAFLAVLVVLRSTTSISFGQRDTSAEDELTRANRTKAAFAGLWAATLAAAGGIVIGRMLDIAGESIAFGILLVGAAVTGVRFAMLEAKLS